MTPSTQLILQTVITGEVCYKLCIPFWFTAGITKCLEKIRESPACYSLVNLGSYYFPDIDRVANTRMQKDFFKVLWHSDADNREKAWRFPGSNLPIWSRYRYPVPSRCWLRKHFLTPSERVSILSFSFPRLQHSHISWFLFQQKRSK